MIQGNYDTTLVVMSVVVAIMAAYTAIDMARRIASTRDGSSRWWLLGGAIAMGTGIWSMHFVGMLAFQLPLPMGYDAGITLLSWLIGVAASAFALWQTARPRLLRWQLATGAAVLGAGIAGMHYTGMAAMRMQPAIRYDPQWFALSIAVAVMVSGVGLHLLHRLRATRHRIRRLRAAAAMLIGLSIVGMHYTAMFAARFAPGSVCGAASAGLHSQWLAGLVIFGTLGVLTMALVISVLDERLESRTAALASSLAHANRELAHLALHDALTRLPNRRLFEDRLTQAIAPGARFALVFMDLDGFKAVNDVYGHHTGDLLLVEIARRLESVRLAGDVIARQGGDEFVMLVHVTGSADAEAIAQRLIDLVHDPVTVHGRALHVSTSVGIALYPEDGDDPSALLSNADAAMYHAKEQGRNGFSFFAPAMNARAKALLQLGQALAPALARREFRLLYQPKYRADDGSLVGVEALVRWQHPAHGMVAPDVFIPLAEHNGLIIELGAWILDEACRQLAEWNASGLYLQMSVNLSAVQFGSTRLVEDVGACLARYALTPAAVTLEITESVAMQDVTHSLRMLRQLRRLGTRISIDDFGTGYSSLAYLKRLSASELKIDRSFVQHLDTNHEDAAIVAAIISMGKTLGLSITAEGVETAAQRDFLVAQGCDVLQGFLLGHPMSAEAVRTSAAAIRAVAAAPSMRTAKG